MKIVLNKCFGGFGLSDKGVKRFRELEEDNTEERFYEVARENPNLITVVEELGDEANGDYAELVVVEIPDGYEYKIDEYDGIETAYYGRDLGEV